MVRNGKMWVIQTNHYEARYLKTPDTAVFSALEAVLEKKAIAPVVLDLRELTLLTDYFLITSGDTLTHVRALASAVEAELRNQGWKPEAVEGKQEGKWVLLDYGEFIVHIFRDRERRFYNLEQFWHKARVIKPENWAQDKVDR
jgi:ribosome-associated protein